jgi:hypothetical protein
MSQWAGATLYLRVSDGAREVYIPQGLTLESHPHSCWKVKKDPTGKSFFVNVAGLGKKWRLPDIYDPKNMMFIRGREHDNATAGGFDPLQVSRTAHAHSQRRGTTQLSYGDFTPNASRTPGPESSLPILDITPAGAPPRHAPLSGSNAGASFMASNHSVPEAISTSMLFDDLSGIPGDFEPQPRNRADGQSYHISAAFDITPPPPMARQHTSTTANKRGGGSPVPPPPPPPPPGPSYGGDDDDWAMLSPLAQIRLRDKRAKQERDRELAEVAEAQFITQVAQRRYTFDMGDPEEDARSAASPERLEAEQQVEARLAEQRLHAQARLDDMARSATMVSEEAKRRDDSYAREMHAVEELERDQLEAIRSHTLALTVGPALNDSSMALAVDPRSASPPAAGYSYGPLVTGGGGGGPDPWRLLQEQLDHHRMRAERLQGELEDRDRAILEHKLADAEREQRDVALRIRMVEALAAYREREVLLAEEEADARQRALEVRASGRRSHSGSVPRHPLFEADLAIE